MEGLTGPHYKQGELVFIFLVQDAGTLMGELFNQYGPTGLAFSALLAIVLRQNKNAQVRIEALEKQQQEQHQQHLSDHKAMIEDYVDLVRNKTRVLSELTCCLGAIKDALERGNRDSS